MDMTHEKLDPKVEDEISKVLKEGRVDKNVKPDGKGKEPCLLMDVERIIAFTDDLLPTKAMEASLWLVAVSTGARAITASNVLLSDIGSVILSDNGTTYLLKIKFRVTKGDPYWNHDVTLEGMLDEKSNTDPVYWINQHLQTSFGLSLNNRSKWILSETEKKLKLWDLSKDNMTQYLRRRAQNAGYPHDLFSFHSFRGGFMSSTMISMGINAHGRDSAIMYTAAVAGWIPNSKAQLRYCKNAVTSTVVSTRLADPEHSQSEVVDKALLGIEAFHNINLNEDFTKEIDIRKAIHSVRDAFKEKIKVDEIKEKTESETKRKREDYKRRTWKNAVSAYVKKNEEMEKEASEIYTKHKNYKSLRTRFATVLNVRVKVGIKHLIERVKNEDKIETIVDELTGLVGDEIEGKKEMRKHNKKAKFNCPEAFAREKDEKGQRKRIKWTEEEDEKLKEMVQKHYSFIEMAKELKGRFPNDCRDRLRNLKILENWKIENATFKKMKKRRVFEILKDDDDSDNNDDENDDDEFIDDDELRNSCKPTLKRRKIDEFNDLDVEDYDL
ncbi:uncharacterized protein MONOS_16643 [Monocercomonoides exilis]|uniref:uncharacterized protein n=1 Tax=Monocercomonoides exilis TaxID=2049356 RepID=UPI00355A6CE9|nr:hypothetical protein MONOS_16643 [Monocercomonoides exilis]|eukprot:MONOS_16643.1-p1 / transcript=MONOS_16643.1 / gene=MONOS_16643 / organism=Monocercomonoides_exilis_PA203 / gene_product=unspecified product / transcript_product=unspecified product / location=Mono_scaffold01961:73-1734(+) / protein_length=553 / sequence_SO=supercontig / SO=protein_coding / is_pseudo=false